MSADSATASCTCATTLCRKPRPLRRLGLPSRVGGDPGDDEAVGVVDQVVPWRARRRARRRRAGGRRRWPRPAGPGSWRRRRAARSILLGPAVEQGGHRRRRIASCDESACALIQAVGGLVTADRPPDHAVDLDALVAHAPSGAGRALTLADTPRRHAPLAGVSGASRRPRTIAPASGPLAPHRNGGSHEDRQARGSRGGPDGWRPSSGSRSPAWRPGWSSATSTPPARRRIGGLAGGAVLGAVQAVVGGIDRGDRLRWVGGHRGRPGRRSRRRRRSRVGYRTDTASLVVMGAVSGAAVGLGPGARRSRCAGIDRVLWAVATPVLWAGGWLITSQVIVDADRQHAVFGSSGALAVSARRRRPARHAPAHRTGRRAAASAQLDDRVAA